jgi:N-acetyl-alpha-D-glucosaminyl L-malate synthase BshA
MAQVAGEERLDLLHVHYAIPHATAAFMARQMVSHRLRVITTLHGTDITLVGNEPSFHGIVKFSTTASDGVTAVSEYLKRQTVEQFQVDRSIEVIYNFVDTQRFRPGTNGQSSCFGSGKVLMHISNFRPVKRILDIVQVFARVRRVLPARLVMIGDGPERLPAEALAEELGLQDDVHFLGQQIGVEKLLGQADLFLLPSDGESFGLGALEAMSCGVPVIGCQKGGLPEVVVDGETGFLAPVGDVQKMAEDALKILQNSRLHKQMGDNARDRVVTSFDAEQIVPQYEDFYVRIVGN